VPSTDTRQTLPISGSHRRYSGLAPLGMALITGCSKSHISEHISGLVPQVALDRVLSVDFDQGPPGTRHSHPLSFIITVHDQIPNKCTRRLQNFITFVDYRMQALWVIRHFIVTMRTILKHGTRNDGSFFVFGLRCTIMSVCVFLSNSIVVCCTCVGSFHGCFTQD
jgi:hypothetical protein